MNCLNQAIAEERIHQVRLLLSLDVDCETRDKRDNNRTPLLKASRLGCEDSAQKIMKILVKFGVKINAVDDNKRSALHYACNDGKCDVIKLLLKEDAIKLNEFDQHGRTPLMLAASNGHLRAARIMILRLTKFDLDIDLRDNKGYTALLLAIKNQNYAIARDLICYGNACSTLRDNEEFKNASEWLKKTLNERESSYRATKLNAKTKKREDSKKTKSTFGDDENSKGKSSRIPSAVPLLTVTNNLAEITDQETDASVTEVSISGMVTAMKEAAAKSGLLFEPDPYGTHSRPPSGALSKISLTSSKNVSSRMGMPEQLIGNSGNTRPSTGVDTGSVVSFLAPQADKRGDELVSTAGRSLLSASSVGKSSRLGKNVKSARGKTFSAKKSIEAKFKVDLGSINVVASEYSYSVANTENEASLVETKDLPLKDLSKNNLASILALKQALKNQKKDKVSRSSTALSQGYATVTSERVASASLQPRSAASRSGSRLTKTSQSKERITSGKAASLPSNVSMRSLYSQSNISEDIPNNNYLQPSSIEKAKRNIRTLFSLYTESLLWTPTPPKPSESLIVQGNESDKMTLASELTASVSDLASIVERGSVAPSEDGSPFKQEAKTLSAKSRLMSATSKASRRSARVTSSRNSSAYR